jgi:hypothetical protein
MKIQSMLHENKVPKKPDTHMEEDNEVELSDQKIKWFLRCQVAHLHVFIKDLDSHNPNEVIY